MEIDRHGNFYYTPEERAAIDRSPSLQAQERELRALRDLQRAFTRIMIGAIAASLVFISVLVWMIWS